MEVQDLIKDQDYLALPQTERAKVVEHLVAKDKDFTHLPKAEQIKVLNHIVQYQPKQVQQEKPQQPSMGQKVGEFFTKPVEDHEFSFKDIAASGAVGAAMGAPFGGLLGAAAGGALGLISGTAGELARSTGKVSEAGAMGIEMATGGLGGLGKEVGKFLSKIPLINWKVYKGIKEAELLGKEYTPEVRKVTGAEKAVKEKKGFVERPEIIPVGKDEIHQATQKELSSRLNAMGVPVVEGEKASDAVRRTMYQVMERLNENGLPFVNSPQMRDLALQLDAGVSLKQISPSARNSIMSILRSPLSRNPVERAQSNEAINNLIQSGEVYSSSEGKSIKIFDPDGPVGQRLRGSFDAYLKNATGNRLSYEGLKSVEKTEFQAKAMDKVSEMLATGFKKVEGEDFKQTMKNIKGAGEQGKKVLGDALNQHFFSIEPDKMMREITRLRPALVESKIFTPEEFNSLQKRIASVPRDIPAERRKRLIQNVVKSSIYGATLAETGAGVRKYTEE